MKSGYTVGNIVSEGNRVIEVINNPDSNFIMNLGWFYMKTLISLKGKNTIGAWKIKQQNN